MDINLEQRSNTYFSTKDNAIYSSHLSPQPFEILLSIVRQKMWLINLLLN